MTISTELEVIARDNEDADGRWPPKFGRRDILVLLGFSIAYSFVTVFLAHRKLFWTDELLTVYLARLSASDLWTASCNGPNQLPPLGDYSTSLSFTLLGEGHVAARLPAILGYLVMSLALYGTIRRRSGTLASAVSMLFPLSTLAYEYAYEARPYGLLLGASALALYFWDGAASGRHPALARFGLFVSLATAYAAHWFGTLLLVPLAMGELESTIRRRRLDPSTWLIFLASLITLLLWLPMLASTRRFATEMGFDGFGPGIVLQAYASLFRLCWAFLIPLMGLVVWLGFRGSEGQRLGGKLSGQIDAPLGALMVGLLSIPILAAFVSAVLKGIYSPRYVLPAILGASYLSGLLISPYGLRRDLPRRFVVGMLVAISVALVYQRKIELQERSSIVEREGIWALLSVDSQRLGADRQIVVPSVHVFFRLHHYSPPEISSRLRYAFGFNLQADTLVKRLAHWHETPSCTEEDILASSTLYVYEDHDRNETPHYPPLIPRLIARGARISDSGWIDSSLTYPRPGYLYRVDLSAKAGAAFRGYLSVPQVRERGGAQGSRS